MAISERSLSPHRTSRPATDVLGLAAALADAARCWRSEDGLGRTLDAVVRSATIIVPGVRRASVSLLEPKRVLGAAAWSDDLIAAVDRLQRDLGEGPGLDAALRHDPSRTDDLARDDRWPGFGPRAAAMGIRSMLSAPLLIVGECLGALMLASDRPAAFDEQAEHLSGLFAAHAAIAVSTGRREQQLWAAVSSRDLIGQAKGVLMQRHRISADEAFQLLARTSQQSNVKLRDVAGQVVDQAEAAARAGRRRREGQPENGSRRVGSRVAAS